MSDSRSLLSLSEIEGNRLFLVTLLEEALSQNVRYVSDAHLQQVHDQLLTFMTTHHIALQNNLISSATKKKDERAALLNIMQTALHASSSVAAINAQLVTWKNNLHHAVYGKGKHVALHTSVISGFAQELMQNGRVSLEQWGTDLDIKQCLKHHMTDASAVKAPGVYILPPVNFTEVTGALQAQIETACHSLVERGVNEPVSLCIPLNCGNSHWRLAKIHIQAASVISAELWDSMGQQSKAAAFTKSSVYLAMKAELQAVAGEPIDVAVKLTGKQKNAYSCMDFVIQEACRVAHIQNAITEANSDVIALRKAVVKQIVANHPQLGAVEAASLKFTRTAIKRSQVKSKEVDITSLATEAFLDALHNDKDLQVSFDGVFAKKLQDLYDSSTEGDRVLVENAFQAARAAYSLFSSKKPDIEMVQVAARPSLRLKNN